MLFSLESCNFRSPEERPALQEMGEGVIIDRRFEGRTSNIIHFSARKSRERTTQRTSTRQAFPPFSLPSQSVSRSEHHLPDFPLLEQPVRLGSILQIHPMRNESAARLCSRLSEEEILVSTKDLESFGEGGSNGTATERAAEVEIVGLRAGYEGGRGVDA